MNKRGVLDRAKELLSRRPAGRGSRGGNTSSPSHSTPHGLGGRSVGRGAAGKWTNSAADSAEADEKDELQAYLSSVSMRTSQQSPVGGSTSGKAFLKSAKGGSKGAGDLVSPTSDGDGGTFKGSNATLASSVGASGSRFLKKSVKSAVGASVSSTGGAPTDVGMSVDSAASGRPPTGGTRPSPVSRQSSTTAFGKTSSALDRATAFTKKYSKKEVKVVSSPSASEVSDDDSSPRVDGSKARGASADRGANFSTSGIKPSPADSQSFMKTGTHRKDPAPAGGGLTMTLSGRGEPPSSQTGVRPGGGASGGLKKYVSGSNLHQSDSLVVQKDKRATEGDSSEGEFAPKMSGRSFLKSNSSAATRKKDPSPVPSSSDDDEDMSEYIRELSPPPAARKTSTPGGANKDSRAKGATGRRRSPDGSEPSSIATSAELNARATAHGASTSYFGYESTKKASRQRSSSTNAKRGGLSSTYDLEDMGLMSVDQLLSPIQSPTPSEAGDVVAVGDSGNLLVSVDQLLPASTLRDSVTTTVRESGNYYTSEFESIRSSPETSVVRSVASHVESDDASLVTIATEGKSERSSPPASIHSSSPSDSRRRERDVSAYSDDFDETTAPSYQTSSYRSSRSDSERRSRSERSRGRRRSRRRRSRGSSFTRTYSRSARSYASDYTSYSSSVYTPRSLSPHRAQADQLDATRQGRQEPEKVSTGAQTGLDLEDMVFRYHWNTSHNATIGPSFGLDRVDPTPVATLTVGADAIEAMTSYNPHVLALTELIRSQVALTRQFMESHKALHRSLVENVQENFSYTTLEDTKEFIHKRQSRRPKLTFEEAVRQVKEDMNISV